MTDKNDPSFIVPFKDGLINNYVMQDKNEFINEMNINKKDCSINFEKSGEDIESKNKKTIDLFDNNETTNNSNTNNDIINGKIK